MPTVSGSDFRRILEFVHADFHGTPEDPLPTAALEALRDCIDADLVDYFELRRSDRKLLAYSATDDMPAVMPGTDEAMLAYGYQNPLNWRRFRPADGPMRFSEVIGRRELERLDFYWAYLRPNQIRDQVKVWLSSSAESAACLVLYRADTYFSRRDQDVMRVLQGHLVEMRRRALHGTPFAAALNGEVLLTTREAEVLTWVAGGRSNDEIAALLGVSPATIGKHLEHAYEKLGVSSRAEALWRLTAPDGRSGLT